jgi:D-glycero-D-manno-heptose 1,7-bisphosphate phosphatase
MTPTPNDPRPPATPRRAVFLDRDDTLIHCDDVAPGGDLGDPTLVRLLPGAGEAVRRLAEAGFALVVVTNQGGVARGRYGVADVEAVHRRLNELLEGRIEAFRFCPYHPEGTVPAFTREHPWRKPSPGMFLDAGEALGIDLERSWAVGDKARDCEAGKRAGCRTILVGRPHLGAVEGGPVAPEADFRAPDVGAAAELILTIDP